MVDVTATETGSQKTTVTLTDGRYVMDRVTSYLLKLETAVSPFPVPVPPNPNPLENGGQYLPFTAQPYQEEITVGDYHLRVDVAPVVGEGVITEIPFGVEFPTLDFSFAIWARKVNPASASGDFVTCQIGGAWNMRMYTGAIETVEAYLNADSAIDPASTWWTDDAWHLIVMTKNAAGTMRLYRDGSLVATNPTVGPALMDNPIPTLYVGGVPIYTNLIGTGAAWVRELDADEVTYLWLNTNFPSV